jgi:hypothetical protein
LLQSAEAIERGIDDVSEVAPRAGQEAAALSLGDTDRTLIAALAALVGIIGALALIRHR